MKPCSLLECPDATITTYHNLLCGTSITFAVIKAVCCEPMIMLSLWNVIELCMAVIILVQCVRLVFADADLTLLWKEHFGLKPSVVLRGQVMWITGASSGIGEYLSYELAKAGCRLVLSARREEELERVKKQCLVNSKLQEDDVLVLPLDVVQCETHRAAVDRILQHFGHVDVLVNNAGCTQRAYIADTTLEVDRQMFDINVLGSLSLTKAVLPHMLQRQCGHVVVMSSIAGLRGMPGSASYSMTKFALHGWFEALEIEHYDDNITVSIVCPGPTFSNLLQNALVGEPGKVYGMHMKPTDKRLKTTRVAELIAVTIANKLPHVWLSLQPFLLGTYLQYYAPSVITYLMKKIGKEKIALKRDSNE